MNQKRARLPKRRGWVRLTKLLFAFSLVGFLLEVRSQSIDGLEVTGLEVESLVQHFYFEREPEPCATLQVDSIHKDFERKGFFRIGVLPLVAMEKFQFEISKPELAAYGFDQIQAWIKSAHGGNRVELRNVSFIVGASASSELTCERLRFGSGGEWELLDGVNLRAGTNELHALKATLQVGGPDSGRLILKDARLPLIHFFSTNLNLRSLQKERSP